MELEWKDLPKKLDVFTVRNAAMVDIRTKQKIQYYLANTKISVAQKCILLDRTYYRTESAVKHGLDWAFEASAFGLPNEYAPSVPTETPKENVGNRHLPNHTNPTDDKQTSGYIKVLPAEDGEPRKHRIAKRLLSKLFKKK